MAAKKKSSGSKAPKKKAAAKKKAAPKKKKAAPKKKAAAKKKATPKKKAAATKKAAPKKKAAPTKKAAPKQEPTLKKQAAGKTVAAPAPARADAAPKKVDRPAGSVSSMDVNLGHVFAVRPRLNTSFRQHDFFEAKRALDEEVYSNIHEAARAVAEEALAITRGAAVRPGTNSRR